MSQDEIDRIVDGIMVVLPPPSPSFMAKMLAEIARYEKAKLN